MALESPLVNSPANMMSTLSPFTEFSLSPNSPGISKESRFQSLSSSARNSLEGSSLRPGSMDGGLSPAVAPSPSDMVGPSPVTSNGTATTDIEDEVGDGVDEEESRSDSVRAGDSLRMINTSLPEHYRAKPPDEPSSVIHAPQGYLSFANTKNDNPAQSPPMIDRSTPTPYHQDRRISVNSSTTSGDQTITPSPVSPPPIISTNLQPSPPGVGTSTPRAQTRPEIDLLSDKSRIRSSSASSLEGIPEDARESEDDATIDTETDPALISADSEHEIAALKTALHECWTLCNTLASLSSIHRERLFSFSGTGDTHEKAWKCCWRLCQKLYESRDDPKDQNQTSPTLELCRDFCQALFDVRQRKDEIADSVLRVSFELNNHLFNTVDRTLPEAFRERTLDFYITLCHRLMKQRSELAEETDSLLRACWSLAEMLFSLRQNRREDKPPDEELLGSAVQACWELCDLFREGWTQVRPERGTPRPSQTTFSQTYDQLSRSSHAPSNSIANLPRVLERAEPRNIIPETPTTEFEDTPISPEDNSPSIPNILVLGTEGRSTARWSSNSSNLSGYSQGSNQTSSTVKTATGLGDDANLIRLKILILKAAMNVGFTRTATLPNGSSSSTSSNTPAHAANALQSFVKALAPGSFGRETWCEPLLKNYKDLVASDPVFRSSSSLPPAGKRAAAPDVANSVSWMMRDGRYVWLKDLYRLVFGFGVEGAEGRGKVGITV